MEITAIYKGHGDATEGVAKSTGNPWRKVTAIFETIEHYPKTLAVSFMNSGCEDVFKCRQGGLYRVRFDVESREYNGKWYTDLRGWSLTPEVSQTQGYATPQGQPAAQPRSFDPTPQPDDLPFI